MSQSFHHSYNTALQCRGLFNDTPKLWTRWMIICYTEILEFTPATQQDRTKMFNHDKESEQAVHISPPPPIFIRCRYDHNTSVDSPNYLMT